MSLLEYLISIILISSCTCQIAPKDTFQIKEWHVINANKGIDRYVNDTLTDLSKLKFAEKSLFSKTVFDSIARNSKWDIEVKFGKFVFQVDTMFNIILNDEKLNLCKIIIGSSEQNFAYDAIYSDKYGIIIKNYNGHGFSVLEHIQLFKDDKLYEVDLKESTKQIQKMNLFKRKDTPPPMKSN